MKKMILTATMMLAFAGISLAQIDYDTERMKGSTLITRPGAVLVYGVDFQGTTYDFIVHVKQMDNGLTFEYEMTNSGNTKGTVHISAEAMDDAIGQNNYFSGGELELTDQTTVWVSRKVLMDLIEDGSAGISPDGQMQTKLVQKSVGHDYQIMNDISGQTVNDLSYVYAESLDGSAKYWIHLNESNPVILKMDLGWTIWLKEMRRDN